MVHFMTRNEHLLYHDEQLSLGILDEMMTLATGALKRAVYGIMPNEERQHHG